MATEVPNRRLRQPASRLATKSHPGERKSHRIRTLFSFFLHFFHFIRLRNGHAGETSGMKKCETKSEPERKKKTKHRRRSRPPNVDANATVSASGVQGFFPSCRMVRSLLDPCPDFHRKKVDLVQRCGTRSGQDSARCRW